LIKYKNAVLYYFPDLPVFWISHRPLLVGSSPIFVLYIT